MTGSAGVPDRREDAAAPPLTYETLKKAMVAIRDEPHRVHGTESDPHIVSPSGKRCIVCFRVVA